MIKTPFTHNLYKAFGIKKQTGGKEPPPDEPSKPFNQEWWDKEIENPSSWSMPKTDHFDESKDRSASTEIERVYQEQQKRKKNQPPPDHPTQGEPFSDSTPWIQDADERDYMSNQQFRRKIDHMWGTYHDPKECPECAKKHADPNYGKEDMQAMHEEDEDWEGHYQPGGKYYEEPEDNGLNKMLQKAFGLRKRRLSDREKEAGKEFGRKLVRFQGGHPEVENEEEGTPFLPFGMNPRQYRMMAQHFKIVWPFNPDSAKGEKDAWYMFQNENGPWYARGLYGRVHSTKQAGIGLQYSAPRQWHSRSEFESGIPGQTHSAEHFGEIGGGKGRGHEFRTHDSGLEHDSFDDPTIRFDRFHPEFKISPNYVRFRTNPQDVTADTWKGEQFLPDDTVIRNLDNLFPHINPPRSKAGVYPTSQETWAWDI